MYRVSQQPYLMVEWNKLKRRERPNQREISPEREKLFLEATRIASERSLARLIKNEK